MKTIQQINQYSRRLKLEQDFDKILIDYRFKEIEKLFKNKIKKLAVLEMGCAEGFMTENLIQIGKILDVVDIAKRYLTLTKKRLKKKGLLKPEKVNFFESFFENFRPPRKYNIIIMSSILHEVDNPKLIFRKAKSWLKSDGILHINVPNAYSFHRLLGKEMGLLKDIHNLSPRDRVFMHQRVYDLDRLKKEARSQGLKITGEGGIFFKLFTHKMMAGFMKDKKLMEGLYKLGQKFPYYATEIFINCKK